MAISQYYSRLVFEPTEEFNEDNQRIYTVIEDFTYRSPTYGIIQVPAGTQTDLASVPPCFQMLFPKDGPYLHAAVVHDYMYQEAVLTKKDADRILRESMKLLKIPAWRRFCIYWGARLFGRGNYR